DIGPRRVGADHRCTKPRQRLAQNAAPAPDVEDPQVCEAAGPLGVAVELTAGRVPDIGEAGRIELVQHRHLAARVPPKRYPKTSRLMITADGGGSNGHRLRLWKIELQRLAKELRIPITVCHLPPGTSKWNKIEHRLFSFIT